MLSKVSFSMFLVGLSLNYSVIAQNWNQIIKAVASDRTTGDLFGNSVAISGDYAIVGAYSEDEDAIGETGSAYIFKRSGTEWVQEAKIVASDRAAGDVFGISVAISGDYAIVGAYGEDEDATGGANTYNAGSAYIFKRSGTIWMQEAKIVASDRAVEDNFGESVAISGDYAIVGVENEDEDATGGLTAFAAGSAYIFKRNGTTWAQEAKIVALDRAVNDKFGTTVAISDDYAIVGAENEDEDATGGATASSAGSAYIFKRNGTTWAQEAKIIASDRTAFDNFGTSVAISGDYAIVGAHNEDEDASGGATASAGGSAYIFKRSGTTWVQEAKIVASDRAAGDRFGASVAISGDYAIAGAFWKDEIATGGATASNAGSAYIFKRSGTTWAQETKIVASDRGSGDLFGLSVAISGDYAIVGALYEDNNATGGDFVLNAGSAYFFQKTVALPVELLNFSGQSTEGGNLLSWQTANEHNNKGFSVERLVVNGGWLTIGFVNAQEKSSIYQFTDNLTRASFQTSPTFLTYYRLRQIDNNGKKTLSKIISIQSKGTKGKLSVYPNPISNILTIENTEGGNFEIINLLGEQVLTGKTIDLLDVSALPQGTYIFKVGTQQAKFVKQ